MTTAPQGLCPRHCQFPVPAAATVPLFPWPLPILGTLTSSAKAQKAPGQLRRDCDNSSATYSLPDSGKLFHLSDLTFLIHKTDGETEDPSGAVPILGVQLRRGRGRDTCRPPNTQFPGSPQPTSAWPGEGRLCLDEVAASGTHRGEDGRGRATACLELGAQHLEVSQLQGEEGPSTYCFAASPGEKSDPVEAYLVRVLWRPGRKWAQLIHICLSRLKYKWGNGRINLFKNVIS
nr:uncharacterized protein LOC129038830 [Pongo pygmaeus]